MFLFGTNPFHPRFFSQGEKALAKAQRALSKLKKGTPERRKKEKAAAKIHEKIRNQRKIFWPSD